MDLFTYLMAKNGNNTSVHGDLFSYLLGKGQSQIQTISGTTIYIPDAKKLVSFMMTKESTQDGTPSPDNPVEVKTVKGYENLLNLNSTKLYSRATSTIVDDDTIRCRSTLTTTNGATMFTIPVEVGKSITISYENVTFSGGNVNLRYKEYDEAPSEVESVSQGTAINLDTKYATITTTKPYLTVLIRTSNGGTTTVNGLMVAYSSGKLPYGRYGNNYVAVNVSDGNTTNSYPIPLNNNEIVGLGDYKDELKVDKSGHVFINKKTKKYIFNGSENWKHETLSSDRNNFYLSNFVRGIKALSYNNIGIYTGSLTNNYNFYVSGSTMNYICNEYTTAEQFKDMLSNQNMIVYYPIETAVLIDLQTKVDLKLFKGANTITNSEDGYMTIEYH